MNKKNNKLLFKANIFKIVGVDIYSTKSLKELCKDINNLKNSKKKINQ